MKRSGLYSVLLGLILLFLSGCNLPRQSVVKTEEHTAVPEETEVTPEPTETPTPEPVRKKIVFVSSEEAPDVTFCLSRALEEVCAEGYECETAGSADALDEDTVYAVFAREPEDLSSLAQRFPQAQFIVTAAPGASYQNQWVIWYDEAFFPFLAGLAAASNALDWRSAGLIPNDSPVWGSHSEEAFLNGAHYFCGNCMPSLAPYVSFPLVASLPSDSAPDAWSAQFDELQRSLIYTAFLSEESLSDALLQKMVTLNVRLLGAGDPPAGLENNWLATVKFDWTETLRQIITRSDAGTKQGTIPVVLSVTPGTQGELFSEGKTEVLRRAYADLLSGILSPYSASKEYTE